MCLFCEGGCDFCGQGFEKKVDDSYPAWFKAGSTTPATHKSNVSAGHHPHGARLGPENSTCGACVHFTRMKYHDKTYRKCGRQVATHGAATDTRAKWRGCEYFDKIEAEF
jgi:hypothetical protein